MSLKRNIILPVIIILTAFFSFTQTEAEVKVRADALFKNKEYVEATSLYLRLLSLQPRDYEYSYKYGTCLLFNSNSKQDAIRYLTYAAKSPVPIIEAHFFLGKAYHLNYQFNDAIREYKNYQSKAGAKGEYTAESNRNIAMCENGKNLLTTLTDVIVRKKTEIKQDDFFRLYDLSDIGGSIIVAIDFQTKNDKKYNHKPIVHISPNMENVYFSSYGDGDNLDIYVARRLPGGKFGTPQKIAGGVNTPFDEDFPYMHPNGRELYFSSKGHNSMGGYDIFHASFDADNNAFGDVTNVDFSISSPDDDLLYIVDKENKNAYFSSKRQSQDGKVVVYKVGVERIPIQLAIVKGSFQSSVLPNNPKMTVEVVDKATGRKIGVYNTLKESSYLITFPKGGKYEYRIKIEGSGETFQAEVDIPYLKELRPLKQKIDHELVDSKERIRITNLFDEQFEDAQSIVAQVLKERANLNVNEEQFDTKEIEEQAKTRAVLADLKLENRSLPEIGQLLERTVTELKTGAKTETQIEGAANGIAAGLYNEISAIDNEIKSLVKEADVTESNRRKEMVLSNAKELYVLREEKLQKIQQIQKESVELSSGPSVKNNQQDVKKLEEISKEYSQLVSEGKNSEISNLLTQNKDYLKTVLNETATSASASEELLQKQNNSDKEIKRLQTIEQENSEEVNRLEGEILTLGNQKENAKEKEKQNFQDKIDEKTYQLEEAKSALSKVRTLISEEAVKRDEINRKLNVVHEIEGYKGTTVTKEELAKAKSAVSEEKSRTLKSYIETSLAELKDKSSDSNKGTVALKTIEQYNSGSEEIHSNADWSEYEKQRRLLALNNEKTQELTTYIQTVDNDLSLSEEEKQQQKTAAQKLIQQLKDDQTSLKKDLAISTRKEVENLKTEAIITQIYPDYQEKIKRVQQDKDVSEIEKSEQLNRIDNELITSVSTEINRLKNEQKANEDNTLTNAKVELLEKHRTYLQEGISERKKIEEERRKKEEEKPKENDQNQIIADKQAEVKTTGEIVSEIQSVYQGNLKSDLNQTHNSAQSIQQNIQRLETYGNQLKQQLKETSDITNEQERENRQTVIFEEISRINSRVEELTNAKQKLAQSETIAQTQQTTNTQTENTVKTEAEITSEIQSGYQGNLKSDLEQTYNSVQETEQTIHRLEDYTNQLKQLLPESLNIPNEQERENRQTVIRQEISRINSRVEELTNAKQKLAQSETIAQTQQTTNTQTENTVKTEAEITSEIQSGYQGNLKSDLEQTYNSVQETEQTIHRLEDYTNQLKQLLPESLNIPNEQERENRQTVIRQEISRINSRIEELINAKQKLAQPDTIAQIQEATNVQTENSVRITTSEKTETREQEITSLLASTEMPKTERDQLTKELSGLRREQAIISVSEKKSEHTQLSEKIKSGQDKNDVAIKSIGNTTDLYNKESIRLSDELASEKDPLKQEAVLNQIIANDEQYIKDLERVIRVDENKAITETEQKTRIYSQEQLQRLKRQGVIEFDEITLLKMEKNRQITSASKKEQEKIRQEITVLDERTGSIRKEQDFIDEQLKLYVPLERPLELKDNSIQLTYNEEREITSSENYEKYAEIIAGQNELINKHKQLSKELTDYQQQLETVRSGTLITDEQQKQNTIEKIKMISLSLEELEKEIAHANNRSITYLPTNTDDMMKFQNLVARGINPIKKSLVATALIPLSANGIEFNPSAPAIPELKSIPVGVTTPKGLVYRVQVGAFARPIPEDHFKEFTPVSGEKIENSNITRYMAGYFNNASTVVEARDKIKQIGYSDAFIVAYCDGKRITFGEARRMEERKECIGTGSDELRLEAATNIVKTLGIEDTTKALRKVPEWSYNQSPGAVKATAIEQFDSDVLFFTVQVGVFNRPVEKERLLNLDPLYTLRLDNGQIRYSVGMYGELPKAKLLEKEIQQKGISDAFVTAYYQGKRIDVDKARTLIASGKVKLYSGEQAITPKDPVVKESVKEVELFTATKVVRRETPREERYLQFVTRQSYDAYPREELNRFNSKGNFYYDRAEKRIKSSFYSDADLLPRIAPFSEQVDTLYFSKSDILKSNDSKITFVLNKNTVPGDLSDWLMKFPYRKTITNSEKGLEIHIFDVRLEDAQQMRIMAEILGYSLIETQNLREYDRSDE